MNENALGPWPDQATARFFLGSLANITIAENASARAHCQQQVDETRLAEWLIQQELGAFAQQRWGSWWPALARTLQQDAFVAAAETELHLQTLQQLSAAFHTEDVPLVLLKGAALLPLYPEGSFRTMSDIDLWASAGEMSRAVRAVISVGFMVYDSEDRPLSLQQLSHGEIRLYRQDWAQGLVELHWSAFPGWWLQRVASIPHEKVWDRKESFAGFSFSQQPVYQLAAEDNVLQISVHLAISHQFGMKALQGLLDIALTAKERSVDWQVVARRAQEWRVATAVYTTLDLLDQLIGVDGVEIALDQLRPSRWRCRLLERFVSPASVLSGRDLRRGRTRFLLLLLLVDRPRDMFKLIFRTLWPEGEWLAARYGDQPVSRRRHIWQVLRHGQI